MNRGAGDSLELLKHRLARVRDLEHMLSLASWDQHTVMPPRGAPRRAQALATLEELKHQLFIDAETGRLLNAASSAVGAEGDSDDARLLQLVRRQREKAHRVPEELAGQQAQAAAAGYTAWVEARQASDFSLVAPQLKRIIELKRRYIGCQEDVADYECAFDVVLDDHSPQIKTTLVTDLFTRLEPALLDLVARVTDAQASDAALLEVPVAIDSQRRLVGDVVGMMGFDPAGWRLDDTVHPFESAIAHGDVRITTRWNERKFTVGLYGAMHECGHGLYEAGVPASLNRSPLGSLGSMALHESQSRLWENMIGRGRPFCDVLATLIRSHLGSAFSGIDAGSLYAAVNRVNPSYIRVEADETTYALHIILRFELEQRLLDGNLSVDDLPEAWNARFAELFNVELTDDRDGVLQDIHWLSGLFGYFPAYALGDLIAAQLWGRLRADLPALDDQVREGNLTPLREWLGEHVYRHGSKFNTSELLMRTVGQPISIEPFIRHLTEKQRAIHGSSL